MAHSPRPYAVPAKLQAAALGEYLLLDEMDLLATQNTALGRWCERVLIKENEALLNDLLGSDPKLPRGLLDEEDGQPIVAGLVRSDGSVFDGSGWKEATSVAMVNTVDLDDNEVAFVARSLMEGCKGVVLHSALPNAFIDMVSLTSAAEADLPDGAVPVAIVDALDKNAVLEMLAIAPGPTVYRRHDGQWHTDSGWLPLLSAVKPPPMVKLTDEQIAGVAAQVDQSTAGEEFMELSENDRSMYTTTASGAVDSYLKALSDEGCEAAINLNLALVAVAGRELSPKDVANTERLRRYWLYGKGAAKIRWGTPGAWRRCYRQLVKHLGPRMTPGYCTNLSQRLGGQGVATHVGVRAKRAAKKALT